MGLAMSDTTRKKQIHYRSCSFFKQNLSTLQELVERAISKRPTVLNRVFVHTTKSEEGIEVIEKIFINTHAKAYNIFFGSLIKFESGANKHTVKIDDDAESCDVEQLAPPDSKDGKRREFLDSILYFSIFKNHLVVLQSAGLRTKELERHLNWFLRSCDLIDLEQGITLEQTLTAEAKDKILNTPTKKIRVGTPLFDPIEPPTPSLIPVISSDYIETKNIRMKPEGKGINILKTLGLINESNEGMLSDVLNDNNLEVFVEVSYKYKSKKSTQIMINNLTTALRHSDIDDYEVEFKGTGSLKGGELILSAPLSIKYVNGLVDEQDLYYKISEWLESKIRDGVLTL